MNSPKRKLGILVPIPLGAIGSKNRLLAEGLYRLALSISHEFGRLSQFDVTVVVPRWARSVTIENLRKIDPIDSGNPIPVRSPRIAGPADFLLERSFREKKKFSRKFSLPSRLIVRIVSSWTGVAILFVSISVSTYLVISLLGWGLSLGLAFALIVSAGAPLFMRRLRKLADLKESSGSKVQSTSSFKSELKKAISSGELIFRSFLNELSDKTDHKLAKFVNRLDVDVWVVSTPFGAVTRDLKKPYVTVFPDLAPVEIPTMFLDKSSHWEKRLDAMKQNIDRASGVFFLSEYVRDKHFEFLKNPTHAVPLKVIPPGPPAVALGKEAQRSGNFDDLLVEMQRRFPGNPAANSSWWGFPVIVIPTRPRPYKGLAGFLRGVQHGNRYLGLRIRVILTFPESEMPASLKGVDFGGAVVHLPNLPDDVLGLVYRFSTFAASTSLFEASLPFTVWESTSQGTPCLLAENGVNRENCLWHEDFWYSSIFNPYSEEGIAEFLNRALNSRDEILSIQQDFVTKHYERNSWRAAAEKMLELIDDAVDFDQTLRRGK